MPVLALSLIIGWMAVFLAGYPNGSRRHRIEGTRHACFLPEPAWFMDRVQTYCGDLKHFSCQNTNKAINIDYARVVALAVLSPGTIFSGPLTAFDLEAHLLWRYWGRPEACYSVEIQRCFELREPVVVHARKAERNAGSLDLKVSLLHWLFWPASPISLSSVGLDDVGDCEIPVLWVPEPILSLIRKGIWKSLLLHLSRVKRRMVETSTLRALSMLREQMNWPSDLDMIVLQQSKYNFCSPPKTPLTPDVTAFLVEQVCKHKDVLISNGGMISNLDVLANRTLLLERGVEGLQVLLEAMSPGCSNAKGRNAAISAKIIIDFIRAAQHLRNRGHLKLMKDAIVESLVPDELHIVAKSLMYEPPSSSTLSRYQVILHRNILIQ